MKGERSKETEDDYKGVIIMLRHRTESGWKGSEGTSEESVGKMYFCYGSFRELEIRNRKLMEWL